MDAQARRVLADLRSSEVSVEAKSNELNELKSSIKHHHVPDGIVAVLFEIVRLATSSQHSLLVGQGLSTLGHLLKRLHLQNADYLVAHGPRILPLLIDALGDRKDRHRGLAMQCLSDLWISCSQDVERLVRDSGMISKNPRTKESSMQWLTAMSTENGLPFKSFVPKLMEALEDADGMVRKVAVSTVVALFQTAPEHAKTDLKRQLQQYNVRKTITAEILAQLGLSGSHPPEPPVATPSAPPLEVVSTRPTTLMAMASSVSVAAEPDVDQVEPAYVNTQRELEDLFREMQPHFEGRESEQNWIAREKSVTKLRKITKGNAPTSYPVPFVAGIKGLLDGILKAVNSLRTTLSTHGCTLLQEIAKTVGPGLDPMVEILLQNLIKLCAATKNISRLNGNATVDVIFSNVSYNVRLLQHVWATCQDKNVKPRLFAAGWLTTLIQKHGHHKGHVEHTGGVELMEKCIKKGLADADIGVRENMRKTFWAFFKVWPERADVLMSTLDPTSRRLLEKDAANPNSPKKAAPATGVDAAPTPSVRTVTAHPSKRSLKDAIAAQKREALAAQKKAAALAKKNETLAGRENSRPTSALSIQSAASSGSPSRTSAPPVRSTGSGAPLSRKGSRDARKKAALAVTGGVAEMQPLTQSQAQPLATQSRPGSARSAVSPEKNMTTTSIASIATPHGLASKPMRPPRRPDATKPSTVDDDENMPRRPKPERPESRPLSVYQDSGTSSESELMARSRRASVVLTELTLNEPAQPSVSALSQALNQALHLEETRPVTPRSPAEATASHGRCGEVAPMPPLSVDDEDYQKTVKVVESGINKINNRTLESHGFRRLQSVIAASREQVWQYDGRFEKLLVALVQYLEVPNDELRRLSSTLTMVQDQKPQALLTIRALFEHDGKAVGGLLPRTICGMLTARKYYKGRCNMVRNLERTSEQLYNLAGKDQAHTAACMEAMVELMTNEEIARKADSNPMFIMGLDGVGKLLQRSAAQGKSRPTSDEFDERLGRLVVRCLGEEDADVRKASVQCCREFKAAVGGHDLERAQTFWTALESATSDQKNLLTYYLSKAED
ncbi:MAG: suppressor of tub2 mutation [Thelocarpon superellum]|nr:MAG: suppressor of tub2 mutation [Thelocarpon superellum]